MRSPGWRRCRGVLATLVVCTLAGTAHGQVVFAVPSPTSAEPQPAVPHSLPPAQSPQPAPVTPYTAEINSPPSPMAANYNAPTYSNVFRPSEQFSPVAASESGGAAVGGSGAETCGGCNGASCGGCGNCDDCCTPFWAHRSMIFGDLLFLQARDVDLPFAIPTDGVAATAVPVGPVAVADPDYEAWFRAGFGVALSRSSSLALGYTHYESTTNAATAINAPNVIFPLIVDPDTFAALAFGQTATASYDIDFQLVDLDLRRLASGGGRQAVNYSVGARYGHMDQDFRAVFAAQPGFTAVDTRIAFDGGGPRFGIDGERLLGNTRLTMYGKAAASFLAGQYRATFVQTNAFTG
ncbi:MAG: hypothetical protein HY000_29190, partial [Planctomycetes bacterium]|nr:hypothetical protein [Planctomycetota bacterium]